MVINIFFFFLLICHCKPSKGHVYFFIIIIMSMFSFPPMEPKIVFMILQVRWSYPGDLVSGTLPHRLSFIYFKSWSLLQTFKPDKNLCSGLYGALHHCLLNKLAIGRVWTYCNELQTMVSLTVQAGLGWQNKVSSINQMLQSGSLEGLLPWTEWVLSCHRVLEVYNLSAVGFTRP